MKVLNSTVALVLIAVIVQHLAPKVAQARVVEDWPFEKLKQSADLICICKVVAIEEEMNEGFNLEFSKRVRATLQIESVLDNRPRQATLSKISLIHYAPKSRKSGEDLQFLGQVNGPSYLKLVMSREAKHESKEYVPAVV